MQARTLCRLGLRSAARVSLDARTPNICVRTLVHSARIQRGMDHVEPQRGEYLPEDPTPAKWQRVAQLIAGTTATGSLIYFVLFADFGEKEHCFMPVRTKPNKDSTCAESGYRAHSCADNAIVCCYDSVARYLQRLPHVACATGRAKKNMHDTHADGRRTVQY